MSHYETANVFFEVCETGQGWAPCEACCHAEATFSCQADALADTTTLSAYAGWMKGLLTPVPDGGYDLTAHAANKARETVVATAEFHGTQTVEDGPVPPTGKVVASDYTYVMQFDGDKIRHMTKI